MTLSSQLDGVPQHIGRYVLIQRLAVGGMAELFLARVRGLEGFEKVVVLKRILPHLAEDQDFVQMFLKEARLAATLDHPNIAHVHDIGREQGEYFFTMEYLHGEDLRRLLSTLRERGQRLPLPHALTIVTEAAAGLHFAHEQVGFDGVPLGIVHRDVSPSNVIVTYAGGVKVVDFGIAKAAGPTHASRLSGLKGKAAYMSPEQCRARTLDRRSDVFAIGLLLYELVTGTPAFVAGNDLAVLHRVARADVPDPRMLWPQCPDALRTIITRAVALEPDARYPTALALQLALEAFAHQAHLPLSNAALGQFMHDVFGDRPLPWLEGVRPASLRVAPPREATPATRAKAMPQLTVVAVAPTHDMTATGGTQKVRRDALPAPTVAPPRRRGGAWIGAGAAGLLVVSVAWLAIATRGHSTVAAVANPARAAGTVAQPPAPIVAESVVVPQTPLRADIEPAVADTEPAIKDTEPAVADTDPAITDIEPAIKDTEPESPPLPTLGGKRRRRSSSDARDVRAPAPTTPSPTAVSEPTGPKHSRPDLPANEDPDALLPY